MISTTLTTYRGKKLMIAAIAMLFNINTYGDALSQDNIQLWLKQNVTPLEQPNDSVTYHDNNLAIFNSESYLEYSARGNHYSNDDRFARITKAREKKLLQELSDKLNISLFTHSNKHSHHRLYVNLLKQEIVSKNRIGKLKYEARVTQKRAKVKFRYTF